MKWLVFGAKGWIGQQVLDRLESAREEIVVNADHFSSFSLLKRYIDLVNPERIVCAVGRTYGPGFSTIDYLEQAGKLTENLESNLLFPVWLAQASASIPILYFGTGCIYEYDEDHTIENRKGFREEEEPNFVGSSYSAVKRVTDKIMGQFPHVLNARIRMPISDNEHPRDFITKISNYKKITSIPNSMTVLSDILPILLAILYEGKQLGTLNAVNPGVLEHTTILSMVEKYSGKTLGYENESLAQQGNRLLSKRSNNELSSMRIKKLVSELSQKSCQLFGVQALVDLETRVNSLLNKRFTSER
jgi:nucleoside-diphosphate-sugar epimerase